MRKYLAAAVVVVLVAAAGGYYVLNGQVKPDPVPQAVVEAENALAMNGVGAMLHLDVGYAVAIESRLLGDADDQALAAPDVGIGLVGSLLLDDAIDARTSIDHMVAAALPADAGYGAAGILIGRFPVDDIVAAVNRDYTVDAVTIAGQSVLLLTRVDPDTCMTATPRALHVSADRIVIADQSTIGLVLGRLQSAAAAQIDLSNWRAFRDGRVLSLVVPGAAGDLAGAATHPIARMAAGAVGPHLDAVGPIYAGVAFKAMPARLLLESRIGSSQAEWAPGVGRSFDNWRAGLTTEYRQTVPSLVRVAEQMELIDEDGVLVAKLAVSEDLLSDIGEVPGEFLSLMFQDSGVSFEAADAAKNGAPAEQVLPASEVVPFRNHAAAADLQPFNIDLDNSFDGATPAGPFVIRVDGFRLTEAVDDAASVVEIRLAALSGEIANMATESLHQDQGRTRATLSVTDVRGHDGGTLLGDEPCGADRNGQAASLQPTTRGLFVDSDFVQVPVVSGDKNVRLVAGAGVNDIAAVAGHFELLLPTRTQVFRIDAPFDGHVVELAGVRIKMQDSAADTVSYEVSGEIDRVLSVRALNGAGQYLRGAGGHASGRLLGAGKSVSKNYQGLPRAVEFVVAAEQELLQFPFEIKNVAPHFDTWDRPEPFRVAAAAPGSLKDAAQDGLYGAACGDQLGYQDIGPFRLCMQSMDLQWGGLYGRAQVLAPDATSLNGNLSALELRLSQIVGSGFDDAVPVSLSRFLRLRDLYDEPYLEDTPWLQDDAPAQLSEATDVIINGVQGELVARLPTALDEFVLPVAELGAAARHTNGLTVQLVGFANGGLQLALTGPRDRIVQFLPKDAAGNALATNNARIEPTDEPHQWSASLSVSGRPQTLHIVVAETSEEIVYPFDIVLDRGSQ